MKRTAAIWASVIACLAAAALPAVAAQYAILLRAEPSEIPADGITTATIVAEVRLASGESAPDGLEVRFFASAGSLIPAATTVDGTARAALTSSRTPQIATITAVAGDARQECRVEFTEDSIAGDESRSLSVAGDYVAYSPDRRLIVALGDARLRYRRLDVGARSLQYDTAGEALRAQDEVVFAEGAGEPLKGDRLSYELRRRLGYLRRENASGEFEWLRMMGDDPPETLDREEVADDELDPIDYGVDGTWVVARTISILPGDRIHFQRASIYVEGTRTLSMPNYVVSLTSAEDNIFGQLVNLSSSGGLNLDLPIYLAAGERRLRTLHLRRTSSDSYGALWGQNGWSLGIDDEYSFGRSEGRLSLDDITRSTRSVRWRHRQEWDEATQADLALKYYRYSANYPAAASAHVSLRRRFSRYDVALRGQGTSFGGNAHYSADLTLQQRAIPLGGSGLRCDLAAVVGYGRAPYETVYRPGEPVSYERKSTLREGLRVGIRLPTQPVDERTSLNASLRGQLYHYATGANRLSSDLHLSLQRRLGKLGAATLAYSYSLRQGASYGGYSRQRIDASVYAQRGGVWQGTAFLSYDLNPRGYYGSLDFTHRLPWQGGERWHFDARANISRFGSFSYTDTALALARRLGNYDLRLCFAPSRGSSQFDEYQYAYDYGYGLRPVGSRRLWVELAPRRF